MQSGLALSLGAIRAGFDKDFFEALLPAGTSRVAAMYTDPANPSYDECIQQNLSALGPELVVNGTFDTDAAGWTLGNSSSLVAAAGRATLTNTAALNGYASQALTTVPGATYVMLVMCAGGTAAAARIYASNSALGTQLGIATQSGTGVYMLMFVATSTTTWVGAVTNSSTAAITFIFDSFSVRELTDWSKLVLFDDAVGTVPIFSPLQTTRGRGLLLDRSQGLVRGPELALNGTFDTNTSGWSGAAGTITHAAGKATVTISAQQGRIERAHTVEANAWYELTCDVSGNTVAGGARINVVRGAAGGYASLGAGNLVSTLGKSRVLFLATGTDILVQAAAGGTSTTGAFTVDNISLKKLPGNHMCQPTAGARGEFSARYNLLTSSEDFSVSPWTNSAGVTFAANVATFTTTGYRYQVYNHGSPIVGLSFTYRAVVSSPSGKLTICMRMSNSVTGGDEVRQLVTLTASPQVITLTRTFTGTGNTIDVGFDNRAGIGDAVAGSIIVHSADMRLTADVIPSVSAYQLVRTATDYDTVGFPTYHRSITDDWAKTWINPNNATRVYVFWAGQKLSETVTGMLAESSSNSDGTAGAFRLVAPSTTGSYSSSFGFRGPASTISAYTAPTSELQTPKRVNVFGYASVTEDAVTVKTNNTTVTESSDLGTVTMTARDVFFGARAGTSLFCNTREYAPLTLLFAQTADPLPQAYVRRLQTAYAGSAGITT